MSLCYFGNFNVEHQVNKSFHKHKTKVLDDSIDSEPPTTTTTKSELCLWSKHYSRAMSHLLFSFFGEQANLSTSLGFRSNLQTHRFSHPTSPTEQIGSLEQCYGWCLVLLQSFQCQQLSKIERSETVNNHY